MRGDIMAWVQYILKGVQFTMEAINMMMFIMEETCQTSSMAMGTALNKRKYELCKEILDTTLGVSAEKLKEYTIVYAMPWVPSWSAFYCFYYMQRNNVWYLSGAYEEYLKLEKLGIDPTSARGWGLMANWNKK